MAQVLTGEANRMYTTGYTPRAGHDTARASVLTERQPSRAVAVQGVSTATPVTRGQQSDARGEQCQTAPSPPASRTPAPVYVADVAAGCAPEQASAHAAANPEPCDQEAGVTPTGDARRCHRAIGDAWTSLASSQHPQTGCTRKRATVYCASAMRRRPLAGVAEWQTRRSQTPLPTRA